MALTKSQLDYVAGQIAEACYDDTPAEVLARSLDSEWQIPGVAGVDYPNNTAPSMILYRYLPLDAEQQAYVIERAEAFLRSEQ